VWQDRIGIDGASANIAGAGLKGLVEKEFLGTSRYGVWHII